MPGEGPTASNAPPPAPWEGKTLVQNFRPMAGNLGPTPPPAAPWPVLPGYTMQGELGRGGMGVVYLARQERLNRTVAVKTLLPSEVADPSDLIRFRSEAEAVAAVAHPHVVKVFESGQQDGTPYLVMEYLPAGTLHARLRADGPLPPDAAAGLVAKLAAAVHAAHQLGIIHRDLKPGNVLFDAAGEPRVTDFGLAKRSSVELTRTQVVMGTPAYMPPEQAAGRAKYAGPAADIYALGVILYECLTGLTPFADHDSALMMAQVMHLPPPSPRSRVATVPHDLELICLKCLEKGPEDRYPTAAALAEDLLRFQNREPVSVRPAGAIERAIKWARRRPTQAAVCGLSAVAVVLSLFGAAMFALWRQTESARERADVSARDATLAGVRLAEQNARLESSLAETQAANAEAEQARRAAVTARGELERLAYFRDVGLAHSEAGAGNVLRARQLLAACPPVARNWEWHFTDRLAHPETRAFECTYGPTELLYAAGGELFLAEPTGRLTPVDENGRLGEQVVVAPIAALCDTCVTPDGKHVVIVLRPNAPEWPARLEVWRVADRKRVAAWPVPNAYSLLLTATDGGRVLAGFDRNRLMAFDTAKKEVLWALDDLLWDTQRAEVSPDGKWLVVNSETDMAVVDVDAGRVAARVPYADGRMESSVFSPDATRFVVGTNAGTLHWYKRGDKEPYRTGTANVGGVTGVTFSPDGTRLASGGRDGTVRLWSVETGEELAVFRGHTCRVAVLRFRPDGRELATCDDAAHGYCWPVGRSNAPVAPLPLPPDLSGLVRVSPDLSRLFATLREGGATGVCCSIDGSDPHSAGSQPGTFTSRFAFRPGGRGFACGTGYGQVRHYPASGAPSVTVAEHGGFVSSLEYSGDGRRLLSTSTGFVRVWDVDAQKEILRLNGHGDTAAISPDGKRVAVVNGTEYRIIDLDAGTTTEWKGKPSISVVRFTPDATGLLVGQVTWGVFRYALTAGGGPAGPPQQYLGHSAVVESIALSPDGTRIAAGGADGVVKVWDAASGQEVLGVARPDRRAVSELFFTPDGRLVASTDDGPPVVFDGRLRSR